MWLYTPPEKKTIRFLARRLTKNIVSRFPFFLQNIAVFLIACFTLSKQFVLVKILKKEAEIPFVPKLRHHQMMAMDSYTVRYDWHLTEEEILSWQKDCGLETVYVKRVRLSDGDWLAGLAIKKS